MKGEKMVAEVIINTIAKQLNRTYDYIIPDSILKDIKIGSRVFVPFGKAKQEEGFVIGLKEKSEFANKEIIRIEDSILNENNIELAKLMSKRYFCNISDCIRLMLPPGNTTKNLDNRIKEKTGKFVYLKNPNNNKLITIQIIKTIFLFFLLSSHFSIKSPLK